MSPALSNPVDALPLADLRREVLTLVAQVATLQETVDRLTISNQAWPSRHDPVPRVLAYMLMDWTAFTRFLHHRRIFIINNAAERSLGDITTGRKSWPFCGSDRGGRHTAFMYSMIGIAKLKDVDPEYLASGCAGMHR